MSDTQKPPCYKWVSEDLVLYRSPQKGAIGIKSPKDNLTLFAHPSFISPSKCEVFWWNIPS